MAKKQVSELKRRVLSGYPKNARIEHFQDGGHCRAQAVVRVLSEAGDVLASERAESVEQGLKKLTA